MMPHFVDTDRGLINLDHVARMTSNQAPRRGAMAYCFYGADGAVLGSLVTAADFDLMQLAAPVVPAAAGQTAVLVGVATEACAVRPTPDDIWAERVPIVGWRLCYGCAQPVLIEEPSSNQTLLIALPGGKLVEPDSCVHDSLEAALDWVLQRCQREWDRRYATAAA